MLSANPTNQTRSNSRPLAAWIVRRLTAPGSGGGSLGRRAIPCRSSGRSRSLPFSALIARAAVSQAALSSAASDTTPSLDCAVSGSHANASVTTARQEVRDWRSRKLSPPNRCAIALLVFWAASAQCSNNPRPAATASTSKRAASSSISAIRFAASDIAMKTRLSVGRRD